MKRSFKGYISLFIIATMIVLPMASLRLNGSTASTDQWDLFNFVTKLEILDSDKNVITEGFVTGQQYSFYITFREGGTAATQFVNNAFGYLEYRLPDQIIVPAPGVAARPVYFSNTNIQVGEYDINTDGTVKVRFFEVDNEGSSTPGTVFFDHYMNSGLILEVDASFADGSEGEPISFGAGAGFVIVVPPVVVGKLRPVVTKTSTPDPVTLTPTGIVSYEVILSATGSAGDEPISNIVLTDRPYYRVTSDGAKTYPGTLEGYIDVKVEHSIDNGAYIDITSDDAIFTITDDDGQFVFMFDPGFELGRNDSIKLTYTLKVADFLAANPPANLLSYTYRLGNDVVAETSNGDDTAGSTEMTVSKSGISKTATGYDAGTISWKATVGDGTVKLNGATIRDTLDISASSSSAGESTDTGYMLPALDEIKIEFFNASGVSIGVTNASDAALGTTVSGTPARVLTFTVPAAPADIYMVEIEFSTPYTKPGDDLYRTYRNTIRYDGVDVSANRRIDGETTPVAGPPVPATSAHSKTSNGIYEREDSPGNYAIDYTYAFTVPAFIVPDGSKAVPIFLRDTFSVSGANVYRAPQNLTVKVGTTDGETPQDEYTYQVTRGTGSGDIYWYLYFGAAGTTASSSAPWPFYAKETTITVTYTIHLTENDITSLQAAGNRRIQNTMRATYGAPTSGSVTNRDASVTDVWPVYKTAAESSERGVINYTVILNSRPLTSDNDVPLFGSDPSPALFTDTFDNRLEYISGSLYIEYGGNRYVPPAATPVASGNVITINFASLVREDGAPLDADWYRNANGPYVILYKLRVNNPDNPGGDFVDSVTYNNTANISNWRGSFSNSASVTYHRDNPLTKTMTTDGTNLVKAEITINPDGRKLAPAGITQYEAKDTMSDNLRFYINSIKLYTKTWEGAAWSSGWVEQPISHVPGALWGYTSSPDKPGYEITFILPDEKPVKIVYEALYTGDLSNAAKTIENRIEVFGYSKMYSSSSFVYNESRAQAFGSIGTLRIHKMDAEDSGIYLNGAVFTLYTTTEVGGVPATFGGTAFYPIMTVSTSTGGAYTFTHAFILPSVKNVYLIVETKAPDGYDLPATPHTYFVLCDEYTDAELEELSDKYGTTMSLMTDIIPIVNRAKPDDPTPSDPPPSDPPPSDPPPSDPPPSDPPPSDPPPSDPPSSDPPPSDPPPSDPPPSDPPTDDPSPEQPYTPGGVDLDLPPAPTSPWNSLVPDGDGWIELDEDGVPLGRWSWDDDEEMWIFEDSVPLSGLPRTGVISYISLYIILLGISLAGFCTTLCLIKSRKHKRYL